MHIGGKTPIHLGPRVGIAIRIAYSGPFVERDQTGSAAMKSFRMDRNFSRRVGLDEDEERRTGEQKVDR
jgi:hypothetical protein